MAQEAAKGQIETPDYGAQISFLEQNSELGKNEENNQKITHFFYLSQDSFGFWHKDGFFLLIREF